MKQKIRNAAILGNVLIIFLCLILFLSDVLEDVDRSMYDQNLVSTMSANPHEDILVVAVDERSLQTIEDDFPWSREIYATLLANMNQPGFEASAIAFDMLFVSRTLRNPDADISFADALSQYDNVILPSYTITDNQLTRTTRVRRDELVYSEQVIKPIDMLNEVSHSAHYSLFRYVFSVKNLV